MESRTKLFSDPVHGFIAAPRGLVLALIESPEVQRLRRIRQLGVGHLVFPGAEHTRFGHALGAMALMQEALATICDKGTPISPDEHRAALLAALLHDIGHGPFSHTLEKELIAGFRHEQMSRHLLAALNARFGGALDRTIAMYDGVYERPFFHELISSQLDMDRLDYLRRDSFFTGVVEGRVGVERIIKTMRVHPEQGGPEARLVIESKGVYAAENFIIARRLMYWQVYLHKTVLSGDHLLHATLRRVRRHFAEGRAALVEGCSPPLRFFLERTLHARDAADPEVMQAYTALDDADVLFSLKQWRHSADRVLADLADRFINRRFFRVTFLDEEPTADDMARWREQVGRWLESAGLGAAADADDYLRRDRSRHAAYELDEQSIRILDRQGAVRDITEVLDASSRAALSCFVVKPYVCYPKEAPLFPEDGPPGGDLPGAV